MPWPLVSKPIELTLGECAVTIEIEDENAKMPLGWAVSSNKAAQAALTTFCEWMSMEPEEIEDLQKQCKQIQEQKTFVIDPQPILIKSRLSLNRRSGCGCIPGLLASSHLPSARPVRSADRADGVSKQRRPSACNCQRRRLRQTVSQFPAGPGKSRPQPSGHRRQK